MVSLIKKIAVTACLLGTSHLHVTAQITPVYSFIEKISLPTGDGKWDYLKMDGERERLFVSHFDRVHVIDLNTNKQIGEITGLKGVHGIGLAKDLNKGYITNGTDNTITVFDYNTFKVLQTISVTGKKADAVMYDKGTKRIFVFNNGSGDAVAIDATTDKVVGTVEMGGAPEFAVANEKGSVFNNNEDTNEIFEIDTKTLKVKNKYSVAPNGGVPTGLAFDASTNRLFSVCRKPQVLVVMDASTGKIVQTVPIGGGVDAVVYEKDLKLIMTSNGEGNVTIIHQDSADKYSVVQTLTTKPGQKTMVHRGTTHRIYLSGAEYQADGKTPAPGTFGVYVYGPSPKQ
ncbi:YncE family protein [Spirosoma endbachense]|uniref:YncE family protein n=1 Tax=Spirosoma endbachense TaxID=2666025 RepID=A0A6P1VRR6_9BACT|nr:YncE family protein [Spirosoma endbachense]QHV95385.1 YncE family protein [Spirosoma endbachense]